MTAEIEQAGDLVNCSFETWVPTRLFEIAQAAAKAIARQCIGGKAGVRSSQLKWRTVAVLKQLVTKMLDLLMKDTFAFHYLGAGEEFCDWLSTESVVVMVFRTNAGQS